MNTQIPRPYGKPTSGFEPLTPSLRGAFGAGSLEVLMSLVSQEAQQRVLTQGDEATTP